MKTDFYFELFTVTKASEPIRLLPLGTIYKGGVKREVTKDLLKAFSLPHFKPAIKLGSHEETTPAGGFITGLEVRADGLYGLTELNEKGVEAVRDGAYRYHSPEIIWEGGFENPNTGKLIKAPLIIGDALLHMPHLGEMASMYTAGEPTPIDPKEPRQEDIITNHEIGWDIELLNRLVGVTAAYGQRLNLAMAERNMRDVVLYYFPVLAHPGQFSHGKSDSFWAGKIIDMAAVLVQALHEIAKTPIDQNRARVIAADLLPDIRIMNGLPKIEVERNAAERLDRAVYDLMTAEKCDYNQALSVVVSKNPKLFNAYQAKKG